MHGCLLIDKEEGYTSQAICHRIKKMFNLKKVGHCGTLDPFATGLLIVGINEGTKILSFLETQKKEYQTVIVLGKQTDTGDCTGKIINQNEISELSLEKIQEVLNSENKLKFHLCIVPLKFMAKNYMNMQEKIKILKENLEKLKSFPFV